MGCRTLAHISYLADIMLILPIHYRLEKLYYSHLTVYKHSDAALQNRLFER